MSKSKESRKDRTPLAAEAPVAKLTKHHAERDRLYEAAKIYAASLNPAICNSEQFIANCAAHIARHYKFLSAAHAAIATRKAISSAAHTCYMAALAVREAARTEFDAHEAVLADELEERFIYSCLADDVDVARVEVSYAHCIERTAHDKLLDAALASVYDDYQASAARFGNECRAARDAASKVQSDAKFAAFNSREERETRAAHYAASRAAHKKARSALKAANTTYDILKAAFKDQDEE